MIWVNFAISEQKVDLKNHYFVLKKSKSFECIFQIQKGILQCRLDGGILQYHMIGINRGGGIARSSLNSGQINRIYKKIARKAGLNESAIEGISSHSMRVGAAQDLLNSGASMPITMQRGRWPKTDTVMRYLEHGNCQI